LPEDLGVVPDIGALYRKELVMYKACHSHSDQSECVASLGDRCRQILSAFQFNDKDTRKVALTNIDMIARSGQMILNLLDSWCIGDESVRRIIPQLVGLQTVDENGVKFAGDTLNKTSKLSFVVLGQFQVETCLRNIADHLNVPLGGTGFYRTAENLLNHLSCQSNMLPELNVPALIRNSLHSNGIHHGYQGRDTSIDINSVTYEFINDHPVSCATWEHIAHALENSVGIMQHIFSTATVSAVKMPILDKYASHQ